ncbi:hypothetical protein R6Q57_001830 [Mikania cordata]
MQFRTQNGQNQGFCRNIDFGRNILPTATLARVLAGVWQLPVVTVRRQLGGGSVGLRWWLNGLASSLGRGRWPRPWPMVRTKQPTGKGKGRAEASSSRQPSQPPPQRQRIDNWDDEEDQRAPKPIWGGGPLSGMDPNWQLELFKDKMKELKVYNEGFVCERVVDRDHFTPFRIVKCLMI